MSGKIIQGLALDELKKIKDNSIDLGLIDPPYLIDSDGGGGVFGVKKRQYHRDMNVRDRFKDGMSNEALDEYVRVLKKVNLYIFCNKNQILQYLTYFKDYNYDILTFIKRNPTPRCNNKYLSDNEYIIFIREKGVPLYGSYKTKKKYFLQNIQKNNFNHPTVKPLNIIQTLISNSSKENDIVLDSFAGTGTTGVACEILNRNYVLIEKELEYIDIIKDRLKSEKEKEVFAL